MVSCRPWILASLHSGVIQVRAQINQRTRPSVTDRWQMQQNQLQVTFLMCIDWALKARGSNDRTMAGFADSGMSCAKAVWDFKKQCAIAALKRAISPLVVNVQSCWCLALACKSAQLVLRSVATGWRERHWTVRLPVSSD